MNPLFMMSIITAPLLFVGCHSCMKTDTFFHHHWILLDILLLLFYIIYHPIAIILYIDKVLTLRKEK